MIDKKVRATETNSRLGNESRGTNGSEAAPSAESNRYSGVRKVGARKKLNTSVKGYARRSDNLNVNN